MRGTRLGDAVRHLDVLFSGKSVAGQADVALLRRFVYHRDEDAFTVLVARHGPMVTAVCRDILSDEADVEDAFQATFLILVRRADALWVKDSLCGWLYRVAYNVALRCSRESARRRVRERGRADMSVFSGTSMNNEAIAALHEAIARLPEQFRRALVLCDLEGVPQVEAAQILRVGEATLRRRLAGARDRLRSQLTRHGAMIMLLNRFPFAIRDAVPAAWVTATIAAARTIRPRLFSAAKLAAVIGVVTLIVAAGVTRAMMDDPEPKASVQAKPAVSKSKVELQPVRWIHMKNDRGAEVWVNLDTGLEFRRDGNAVSMLDTAKYVQYSYNGKGDITKRGAYYYGMIRDSLGRLVPPGAFDLLTKVDRKIPYFTPDEAKKSNALSWDCVYDTLDGRKAVRVDSFEHDALGAIRLKEQLWIDDVTRRPVSKLRRYQVADQHRYGTEFEKTTFDYPDTGPADLAALGVPRGTKIVDVEPKKSSLWEEVPAEVRYILDSQAGSVRKFPRDLRVVSSDFTGTLALEYWSASLQFVENWCNARTSDRFHAIDLYQPRSYRADNQRRTPRPKDIERAVMGEREFAFDADQIAAWLPIDQAVNVSLTDGKRTHNLTRLTPPKGSQLHVLGTGYDRYPEFFERQWPLLLIRRDRLKATNVATRSIVVRAEDEIGTGDGGVQPWIRIFTLDPYHDFIAVKQVEWEMMPGQKDWTKTEVNAKTFQKLSNGSWYVSVWEEVVTRGLELEKPSNNKSEAPSYSHVSVKKIEADAFPKDIFNGAMFVEAARKEGAKIETDQ